MTDRELLEAAARAAGIEVTTENGALQRIELFRGHLPNYYEWNPLNDDGDALRLAVKLRLDICTEENDPHPTEDRQICHVNVWPSNGGGGACEDHNGDPYAATRRAIVRAAASLPDPNGESK